jgi:2-methylcitrate dehydratase
MKLPRRAFLSLAASMAALPPVSRFAQAETDSAISNQPLAERLALYAHQLRYEDLDAATIERVKSHVIDALGCGIAAFDEPPVRICREVALASADRASTVIGTDRKTAPDLAAFANGAAFRYYDLNDVYVGAFSGHPSDNIAPCLAVAEAERSSAKELITAIVVAYEINCQFADAFDLSERGWDPPVFSLPAVALAVGKLMKLDPGKLTHAVNIAINDHIPMGQTRSGALSDWKGIADAEAGRNAVFAATLARQGLTGPSPIFEGRRGFFQLISGPTNVNVAKFGGRGVPFKIHQCSMKAYPVVVYGQTAATAAAAVAKEIGDLGQIEAIEVATTRRGYQQTGAEPEKWAPDTRETADHSMPYIVARAMSDGEITNESYAPDKLRDPRILAFMRRITVKADPTFVVGGGSAPPTRITATLKNGGRVTRQVDSIPGFPGQPMSRGDVERKFHSNIGKRWPHQRTEAILQSLWVLDRTDDLAGLLGRLSLPG